MDVDAAQYALISKEMFLSGRFLEVMVGGQDYLDKPPLLFWTTCLSFKVFGIHDWAYRLPSVLCLALGVYSVFRFARLFYDERTAKIAALIMASCCASYLMTNDVRTDTMLTGWVMFSIWQIAEFNHSSRLKNILGGALGIGLAMLTKGPIGFLIPVVAFSSEFIYKKQWKNFFRWQYLPALIVIALVLFPMSYGLYEQFDLHPEKTAYSIKSPSGLKFFFWTQSFGRITGESSLSNNPDPFFLVHSFLWGFLPWTVFFLPAVFIQLRDKIKSFRNPDQSEVISIGGFLVIFLFLSLSKYQLPHYIFVISPLAAVITANYVNRNLTENKSGFFSIVFRVHIFVMLVIYSLAFVLVNFVFSASALFSIFIFVSLLVFLFILFYKRLNFSWRVLYCTILPFGTLVLILNTHFYPNLLSFQTGSRMAMDVNQISSKDSRLLIFKSFPVISTNFYCKLPIVNKVNEKSLPKYLVKGKTYLFADSADSEIIRQINPEIEVVKNYRGFPVTQLDATFLNPATRATTLEKKVLFRY